MAKDIDICSNNWSANKNDDFTWTNSTNGPAVITQIPGSTWPFTLASPIDVAGMRSVGKPGRTDCSILSALPGGPNYTYSVDICSRGNPRTVIIT